MSGCCKTDALYTTNKAINRELEDEKKNIRDNVKLLLLGAGESGKSTIAKQMKIIHLNGFTEEERQGWTPIIYKNVVFSMRILVKKALEFYEKITPENEPHVERLLNKADESFGGSDPELKKKDKKVISDLWADSVIQQTFARSAEFQLNDSASYFFESVDRITTSGYLPTENDVLRARVRTSGIIETNFVLEQFHFGVIDVGGQRSERRKWIHCFQDVTAVLFCVGMSEYNQALFEDETVNRMDEALQLFRDIVVGEWFVQTSIILFLNKRDLFEEKIKLIPLTECFREYTGKNNFEEASAYIEKKFREQNQNPQKNIFVHFTCATDTDNIRFVFTAVKKIVLEGILKDLF